MEDICLPLGESVRFLLFGLFSLLVSACGPRAVSVIESGPVPGESLSLDEGAIILEVIHSIGPQGPQFDRWTGVKVASTMDPKNEPVLYSLERVIEFNGDSAVFAGILPVGTYRIVAFEGVRQGPRRMLPYVVRAPQEPGEFFVAGGKLNSLGIMMQASVGNWSWVYQRNPSFDLPALVRRLRPDLASIDLPDAVPQELRKITPPPSNIRRAYPRMPAVVAGDSVMTGAQFGRVYLRSVDAEGSSSWKVYASGSWQTVIDLLPLDERRALVVLSNGDLFVFDPVAGEFKPHTVSLPGRVIKAGYAENVLHLVTERTLPHEERRKGNVALQAFRQKESLLDSWQPVGEEVPLLHTPYSILVVEDAVLMTHGGMPMAPTDSIRLVRVPLSGGRPERQNVSFQFMRDLGDGLLVAARGPESKLTNFHISDDGGRKWQTGPFRGINPIGWPVLDGSERMLMPGNADRVEARPGQHILSRKRSDFQRLERWEEIASFPMRCDSAMESIFVGGHFLAFCGERVFRLVSAEEGWAKEALHLQQSALP